MFVTLHSAVAVSVVVTVGVEQPILAFGIGWLLHYFGDALPHGDESLGEWAKRSSQPAIRMAVMFLIDLLFLIAALIWLHNKNLLNFVTWAAIVGSILPDLLVGIELIIGRRLFGPLANLHEWAHRIINYRFSPWIGVPLQLVLGLILWGYIGMTRV